MKARDLVSEVCDRILDWYTIQVDVPYIHMIGFISSFNKPRLEKLIEEAGGDQGKFLYMMRATDEYKSATKSLNWFQKLGFEVGMLDKLRRDTHYIDIVK